MPVDPPKLVDEYTACLTRYRDYEIACRDLLLKLLAAEGLRVHSVTSRTKEPDSLRRKALREGKSYQALSDITDLVGLRIITIFGDEVDKIGALIEREFAIDAENSVDKRKVLDPDRFGYLSLHYVCGFSTPRCALTEYRAFHGMTCEVQVRSILQHAWAEIEHDLGYKAPAAVPRITRRQFFRLAGLLELADDEFIHIRDALKEYARDVEEQLPRTPALIQLDKISVQAFLRGPSIAQQIEDKLAQAMGSQIIDFPEGVAEAVEEMQYVGLRTIDEVRAALEHHAADIEKLFRARLVSHRHGSWEPWRGISIFYLFQLLLAATGDEDVIKRGYDKLGIAKPGRAENPGAELLRELRDLGIALVAIASPGEDPKRGGGG